jgi:hypothetical protein
VQTRISLLPGILAVVLWVVGIVIIEGVAGAVPEDASAEQVLAFYRENENAVAAGSWIFMLGALAFMWFAALLRSRLLVAEGGTGPYSTLAFAGAIATAIFALAIPAGGFAVAIAVDDVGAPAAQALDATSTLFFVGAELSAIVLLLGTAVVSLRTRALPRWWAAVSILLAVWLVIGPIGWLGLLVGVPIWTLVTSIILAFGRDAARDEAPRTAAA